MTAKTQALVRDVAALFVKYSLADWAPLIEELEKGGRGSVAAAIRNLVETSSVPAKSKSKTSPRSSRKPTRKPSPPAAISFSPERSKFLEPLLRALKGRVVAPTAHDMRELYLSIGIKEAYPKRREEAAEAIALRLDKLPDEQFRKVIADVVGQDDEADRPSDEYARWFNLILEPKRL